MNRAARALACALLATALLASACAGGNAQPEAPSASSPPVELTLISADGEPFALAQLRGRPLLLFVFTTYDQASQLALTPLMTFLAAHQQLAALGIATQPDPAALLRLYRDTLGVPFPLAYEADPQIVSGESALGAIETVPTYVLLDAAGRVAARHTGALTPSELEGFTEPVLDR